MGPGEIGTMRWHWLPYYLYVNIDIGSLINCMFKIGIEMSRDLQLKVTKKDLIVKY